MQNGLEAPSSDGSDSPWQRTLSRLDIELEALRDRLEDWMAQTEGMDDENEVRETEQNVIISRRSSSEEPVLCVECRLVAPVPPVIDDARSNGL